MSTFHDQEESFHFAEVSCSVESRVMAHKWAMQGVSDPELHLYLQWVEGHEGKILSPEWCEAVVLEAIERGVKQP